MATQQNLLSALARAYSLTETRDPGDKDYIDAVQAVRKVQEEAGWLVVRVEEEGFTGGGEPIHDNQNEFGELHGALREAGIKELRFLGGVATETLVEFLGRLRPSFALADTLPSARFRGLEGEIGFSFRPGHGGLPGMVGGVQELFQGAPAVPESPGEVPFEPSSATPGPEGDSPPLSRLLSPELLSALRDYQESPGYEKAERLAFLRGEAENLRQERNDAALGALIELLVQGEEGGKAEAEVLEFARDFSNPAVTSQIVARLGAARDEGERARLVRVLSGIGWEGAAALADALGESRDRFQRRTFMDALVALGPLGREMAEGMVDDPRWFVVRNGVALLGDLGGEDVVTHLTATLANGDSRVRKEAVTSLGKIGGRDAEILVLGMLEDGDAGVRARACRALGILKPERGFRPLLRFLKDDSLDVRVECLHALGKIGDPGAVPSIEKCAFGRFLSRPPREVRIAAFRALAGIGTHGALRSLRKGGRDKDEAVRTVARTLITMK